MLGCQRVLTEVPGGEEIGLDEIVFNPATDDVDEVGGLAKIVF